MAAHILFEIDDNHGHADANVIVEGNAKKDMHKQLSKVDLTLFLEDYTCINEREVLLILAYELKFGVKVRCVNDSLLESVLGFVGC